MHRRAITLALALGLGGGLRPSQTRYGHRRRHITSLASTVERPEDIAFSAPPRTPRKPPSINLEQLRGLAKDREKVEQIFDLPAVEEEPAVAETAEDAPR